MPIYEYRCTKCKHSFERMQRLSDAPVRKCPECGGKVIQLMSAPAVQFKGSGFYVTDYPKKSSTPASGESAKPESKTESKSEAKSESKSEAKTESKSEHKKSYKSKDHK